MPRYFRRQCDTCRYKYWDDNERIWCAIAGRTFVDAYTIKPCPDYEVFVEERPEWLTIENLSKDWFF